MFVAKVKILGICHLLCFLIHLVPDLITWRRRVSVVIQVRACFDDVLWFQFGGFRKQIVFCLWCCKTSTCGTF